jgi:hypothetical protein
MAVRVRTSSALQSRQGRFALFILGVAGLCAWGAGVTGPAGASASTTELLGQHRAASPAPADEPQVCDGCVPPLAYQGGSVLTESGGLTVIPIYWEPSGGQYHFPTGYQDLINRYISDVAAASGATSNVYSVATEYAQTVNGDKTAISYDIKAGPPLTDTGGLPSNGCPVDSGFTACITDAQLRTELGQVTKGHNLPTDLSHFYPVFLPPGVEAMDQDGTTSASSFCGYHRAFGLFLDQTVYGNLPFPPKSGCDAGQAPNLAADGMASTLSHELTEAITDPLSDNAAWIDNAGHEIGDMCSDTYGPPLGSTDPSNPTSSEYNQVINGDRYYTQTEFSNAAFAAYGIGKGCAQNESVAKGATAGQAPGATSTTTGAQTPAGAATSHAAQAQNNGSLFAEATPTALDADGTSTTKIVVSVADANGNARAGDHVHLSVGAQSGTGECGTLNTNDQTTDDNGYARVTYTASTSNVACWVLAVDAAGGQSAQSVIYQGSTQKDAATTTASFPTTMHAGGSPITFTIKAANPSAHPVPNARITFAIYGEPGAQGIQSDQIHLSYSTTGPQGPFTDVSLDGSTNNGGVIEAPVGPDQGTTLAPHAAPTYTFHASLASSVPTSKTPVIAFEGYLDQINTASGSGDTLGDTYATDISVTPTSSSGGLSAGWYVLIAVGGVLILGLLGWLLWRRRGGHPQTPTPNAAS